MTRFGIGLWIIELLIRNITHDNQFIDFYGVKLIEFYLLNTSTIVLLLDSTNSSLNINLSLCSAK